MYDEDSPMKNPHRDERVDLMEKFTHLTQVLMQLDDQRADCERKRDDANREREEVIAALRRILDDASPQAMAAVPTETWSR